MFPLWHRSKHRSKQRLTRIAHGTCWFMRTPTINARSTAVQPLLAQAALGVLGSGFWLARKACKLQLARRSSTSQHVDAADMARLRSDRGSVRVQRTMYEAVLRMPLCRCPLLWKSINLSRPSLFLHGSHETCRWKISMRITNETNRRPLR